MIGYTLLIVAALLAIVLVGLAAGGVPAVKRTRWGRRPEGSDLKEPLAEEITPPPRKDPAKTEERRSE